MPVKEKLLTDLAIRHAGPGTHNDGNGLTKGGSRSWCSAIRQQPASQRWSR